MRIIALLAAASVVFVLTACQKAEDKADSALTEAVEAAGIPDPVSYTHLTLPTSDLV